jgi:hypothetical protein
MSQTGRLAFRCTSQKRMRACLGMPRDRRIARPVKAATFYEHSLFGDTCDCGIDYVGAYFYIGCDTINVRPANGDLQECRQFRVYHGH